jgi:hypothetical protein
LEIYYIINNKKEGPVLIENLTPNIIQPSTLVWHEGLDSWTKATSVPDLIPYFKHSNASPRILREIEEAHLYDPNYVKPTDATALGVVMLLVWLMLLVFISMSDDIYGPLAFSIYLISAVVYVTRTAKEQNRDPMIWALFALFLPPIALMVIGQQPKYKHPRSKRMQNRAEILDDQI